MARDGENLFRRPDSRYWYFKYKGIDGRFHEESTGKELKSDARDVRNDRLVRYKAGQTPNDMSNWPLKRAIEEHLALRKVQAPKSWRLERTCFNAVKDVFGEQKRLPARTVFNLVSSSFPTKYASRTRKAAPAACRSVSRSLTEVADRRCVVSDCCAVALAHSCYAVPVTHLVVASSPCRRRPGAGA